jgi:hypothetical protein
MAIFSLPILLIALLWLVPCFLIVFVASLAATCIFRLSPAYDTFAGPRLVHPSQANDVALACKWVFEHIAAEPYRGCICKTLLVGHGDGGHIVGMVAARDLYLRELMPTMGIAPPIEAASARVAHPRLQGVVLLSALVDVARLGRLERGVGWLIKECVLQATFGITTDISLQAASPITYSERATCPFLLINATDTPALVDCGVHADNFRLLNKLHQAGKLARQVSFMETNHALLPRQHTHSIYREILDFFPSGCTHNLNLQSSGKASKASRSGGKRA